MDGGSLTAAENLEEVFILSLIHILFNVIQRTRAVENSANLVSDRNELEIIHNKWLNKDIEIQKTVTKSGNVEFSAEIIIDDSYYYLSGIMEEDEFIDIIENLYIERID